MWKSLQMGSEFTIPYQNSQKQKGQIILHSIEFDLNCQFFRDIFFWAYHFGEEKRIESFNLNNFIVNLL